MRQFLACKEPRVRVPLNPVDSYRVWICFEIAARTLLFFFMTKRKGGRLHLSPKAQNIQAQIVYFLLHRISKLLRRTLRMPRSVMVPTHTTPPCLILFRSYVEIMRHHTRFIKVITRTRLLCHDA